MGAPKITSRTHPDLYLISKDMSHIADKFSKVKEFPMSLSDIKYYFTELIEEANILFREAVYYYNNLDDEVREEVEQADKERNAELYNPKSHRDIMDEFYKNQDAIFEELLKKYECYYYEDDEEESNDECF